MTTHIQALFIDIRLALLTSEVVVKFKVVFGFIQFWLLLAYLLDRFYFEWLFHVHIVLLFVTFEL